MGFQRWKGVMTKLQNEDVQVEMVRVADFYSSPFFRNCYLKNKLLALRRRRYIDENSF